MSTMSSVMPRTGTSSLAHGLSDEMRRLSAGMRVVTALLCSLLLATSEPRISAWAVGVIVAYGLWSAFLLWGEASGRARRTTLLHFWIDVSWSCLLLQLVNTGTLMLVMTLVQPVVLASISHGVRQGVTLALFGAAGVLFDPRGALTPSLSATHATLALAVLVVVPGAAMLAKPMSALRSRVALLRELGARIDPRRGLVPTCASLAEGLLRGTQADVAALVLPSALGAPAMIASAEEGAFRAGPQVHQRLEAVLGQLPRHAVTHAHRRWWELHKRTSDHAPHAQALAELARLLDVRSLHVVPLVRYAREHGHLIVASRSAHGITGSLPALTAAAPELLRIVEQAALVDQLQEESAGHERARIGRDLHDSAIQPYLGLKYAVECLAMRIPRDNPAHAEIESLAELVNGEVTALREVISGLRTGATRGDNALVPAVRRQVRRFALLFGLEIKLDFPESLPTSRALASALFHMVNEALNNVRKHTPARHVWITLSSHARGIRLTVRDDGGSVRGRPAADFTPTSLDERARELGGTLHVTRPDRLNTELVIEIPL